MSNRKRRSQKPQAEDHEDLDTSTADISDVASTSTNATLDTSLEEAPKAKLPATNVKERIILVLDRAKDEISSSFTQNGNEISPFEMLKMGIEHFIQSKHFLDHKHEYALIALNESTSTWLVNFTSNLRTISNALKKVQQCETEDIFNLNTLFDIILKNVTVPLDVELGKNVNEPGFVVRVVLFYNRSFTHVNLEKTEEVAKILYSPFFNFDILITHEDVNAENNCTEIFESLQNIDPKEGAYFCPIGRDAKLFAQAIAKLLAHPLQRALQKNQKVCDVREILRLLN